MRQVLCAEGSSTRKSKDRENPWEHSMTLPSLLGTVLEQRPRPYWNTAGRPSTLAAPSRSGGHWLSKGAKDGRVECAEVLKEKGSWQGCLLCSKEGEMWP